MSVYIFLFFYLSIYSFLRIQSHDTYYKLDPPFPIIFFSVHAINSIHHFVISTIIPSLTTSLQVQIEGTLPWTEYNCAVAIFGRLHVSRFHIDCRETSPPTRRKTLYFPGYTPQRKKKSMMHSRKLQALNVNSLRYRLRPIEHSETKRAVDSSFPIDRLPFYCYLFLFRLGLLDSRKQQEYGKTKKRIK